MRAAVAVFGVALLACSSSGDSSPPAQRVRLWHTFNPTETEALNTVVARRAGMAVETTLVPFQRGQTILREVMTEPGGSDCPDLIRMDATWLPGYAMAELLAPVPASGRDDWLPEAGELGRFRDTAYGLPQRLDGLALIYREETIARAGVDWPPATLGALLATAHQLTGGGIHGLGIRVDGYWFGAFLRAWGGELLEPTRGRLGIDQPVALDALERFAGFFGAAGIAGPAPPSGAEAQDEFRRFRAGSLAVVVDGPWAANDLGGGTTDGLGVVSFPRDPSGRPAAPRGGQVLVVPRCARHPAEAWKLAAELTAPTLQADWARRFGVVPTSEAALAEAGPFARSFYQALTITRPLDRHPATTEMFDDLNPAIAAVVAGDATPAEALGGVRRAWTRLLGRHDIEVDAPVAAPVDAGAGGAAP